MKITAAHTSMPPNEVTPASADSATRVGNLKLWSHDEWFHDAIWVHGKAVVKGLFEMLD